MKPGLESQTAVLVCTGRAIGHDAPWAVKFTDPTALALLPDDARARAERIRAGAPLRGLRDRLARGFALRHAKVTVSASPR